MGLFDSFFNPGKDEIQAAMAAGNRAVNRARGEINTGFDEADQRYQPLVDQGLDDREAYRSAWGLNGIEGRREAQNLIFDDPIYQKISENTTNRLFRNRNRGGGHYSGATLQAGNRLALENFNSSFNNHLNHLGQIGTQGTQLAQSHAGLPIQKAGALSNLELTRGSNQISGFNALGQSRQTGMNNLLGLGGLAVKAFGGGA